MSPLGPGLETSEQVVSQATVSPSRGFQHTHITDLAVRARVQTREVVDFRRVVHSLVLLEYHVKLFGKLVLVDHIRHAQRARVLDTVKGRRVLRPTCRVVVCRRWCVAVPTEGIPALRMISGSAMPDGSAMLYNSEMW